MGITKILDRTLELREIDEKFFNCPSKALYCSINLRNEEAYTYISNSNGNTSVNSPLAPLKLSKDARKFFTRLIYKKCLFAKVIGLTNSIFNIVLGVQTQRGIIDVYMHLISKFDRKRYELIRNIQHIQHTQQYLIESPAAKNQEQQFLAANGSLKTISKSSANVISKKKQSAKESLYVNEPLPTENVYYNDSCQEDDNNVYGGNDLGVAGDCESTSSSAFESDLYLNAIAQTHRVPLAIVSEDEESSIHYNDENNNNNQLEEDELNDETDYALFSDIISYFNNNNNFNTNTSRDLMQDSLSTFSLENDEHSLDYTPVKGETNKNQTDKPVSKKQNHAPLKINPVNLPPTNNNEMGTALAPNRKRFAPRINSDSNSTPIRSTPNTNQGGGGTYTSPFKNNNNNNFNSHSRANHGVNFNNYSSDTDTSVHAACCSVNPLKIKW